MSPIRFQYEPRGSYLGRILFESTPPLPPQYHFVSCTRLYWLSSEHAYRIWHWPSRPHRAALWAIFEHPRIAPLEGFEAAVSKG